MYSLVVYVCKANRMWHAIWNFRLHFMVLRAIFTVFNLYVLTQTNTYTHIHWQKLFSKKSYSHENWLELHVGEQGTHLFVDFISNSFLVWNKKKPKNIFAIELVVGKNTTFSNFLFNIIIENKQNLIWNKNV